MKFLRIVLSALSLGLLVTACGGKSEGPASHRTMDLAGGPISRNVSHAPSMGELNDGDKDPSTDEDPDDLNGKHTDEDNDPREDYVPTQNGSYHDDDDLKIVNFGHPAGAIDERSIVAVAMRYEAVTAAGDGVAACSLMARAFASVVAQDYGQAPGPMYLRGARTCPGVMRLLFRHQADNPGRAAHVTSVRLEGDRGVAMLGSTVNVASYLSMRRERGLWKVSGLSPVPLP